jgi:hypothetical protein
MVTALFFSLDVSRAYLGAEALFKVVGFGHLRWAIPTGN